MTIIYTKW